MGRRTVLVGTAVALLAAPATANAARQSGSFTLTTEEPGAATGNRFSLDFRNPADPAGKPYSVKTIALHLAPGSVLDTSVPEQCKATDAELMARGTAACPAGSRVGGGTITSDTGSTFGFPRFVENKVT